MWRLGQTRQPQSFVGVLERCSFSVRLFWLSKRWSCSTVPSHKTQDHCARSQITALHSTSTRCMAYGGRKHAKPHMPAAAYVSSSSSVRIQVEEGVNLGTRRMVLCRSVLWCRDWPSIVTYGQEIVETRARQTHTVAVLFFWSHDHHTSVTWQLTL